MTKELVVLGCASQTPTRLRNHNGYFLRWDGEGILFDPGEGTQRQMLLAGVRPSSLTRICITHFHGDHCFGLPGVFGRLASEAPAQQVDVYYPAAGDQWFQRLRHAGASDGAPSIIEHAVGPGVVTGPPLTITAAELVHRTDTLGWRIEEPDGRRFVPSRLEERGIRGPSVSRLRDEGQITVNGLQTTVEQVSEPKAGLKFALVMDTSLCPGVYELAQGVDTLVCESTYLSTERDLAERYHHLTAADAAGLARDAGVGQLVLTHYSSRYPDQDVMLAEACPIFPNTRVVRDFDVIPVSSDR